MKTKYNKAYKKRKTEVLHFRCNGVHNITIPLCGAVLCTKGTAIVLNMKDVIMLYVETIRKVCCSVN